MLHNIQHVTQQIRWNVIAAPPVAKCGINFKYKINFVNFFLSLILIFNLVSML